MNKKTAAMVLCTVMAAGVLTGCGGAEEKKDGKTTIKYATYSARPDHLEDLDKMVAEFEKQTTIILPNCRPRLLPKLCRTYLR